MNLIIEDVNPFGNRETLREQNKKEYETFIQDLFSKKKLFRKFVKHYCQDKSETSKSGATGEVSVDYKSKYVVKEGYIVKKDFLDKEIFQSFYFPRLKNYCIDISRYIRNVKKILPNNFMLVKKCSYCRYDTDHFKKISNVDVKVMFEMENASYGKTNNDNFQEDLFNDIYSESEIESLLFQIHYIATLCNKNNLFHNDLKPANIVINSAKKSFVYKGLNNYTIRVNKGDLIPILIDYDLCSFKDLDDNHPASGTSDDFFFFSTRVHPKISDKFRDIFTLPGYKII